MLRSNVRAQNHAPVEVLQASLCASLCRRGHGRRWVLRSARGFGRIGATGRWILCWLTTPLCFTPSCSKTVPKPWKNVGVFECIVILSIIVSYDCGHNPFFFESKHAYCRKTNKQSGPRRSIKIVPSNFHAEGKTPCKQTNVLRCVVGPSRKDYEEVGIETAEGEGEEEGYGDEFWVLLRGHWHPHVMCDAQERLAFGRLKLSGITCVQTRDAKNALEIVCCWASLPTIFAGWSWVLYQWYCTYSKFSFWTVRIHSS